MVQSQYQRVGSFCLDIESDVDSQILDFGETKRYTHLLNGEGFMQTYIKNHRASRSSHYAGGTNAALLPVGQDEYGNRYYEDFDVHCMIMKRSQRRWVEYSDYFVALGITGDRVPPGWHGWLCLQYDDFPTRTDNKRFYSPHYQKPHQELTSNTPLHLVPAGSPENLDRLKFINYQRDRRAQPWDPANATEFDGKKLIRTEATQFEDVMANKE